MNEIDVQTLIGEHFRYSTDDIVRASQIYAEDAALEFPQGGERIRGKQNIIAFRSAYPARVAFQLLRTIGRQDLWVNEYVIRYDGENPLNVVGIMEFADGQVVRERIYFGEPWDPPAWRARWVEPLDEAGASRWCPAPCDPASA
jgi:hypothetical protein